ncbi:MAG TPA: M20/M25/M40 family metallo-hydrolase [Bryobacteraceae bacterium]|nr:M20/M25/M40 family metallo-hydrolase [Bryobacteraceae bacterium]
MKITPVLTCVCLLGGIAASAQYKTVNPQVSKIVTEVSGDRIATILKKLEGFGTRNTFSAQDDPVRGIGAARKWIYDQFQSYSPRLEVSYDQYRLKKDATRGSRIPNDVDLYNVVAVLPGTLNKEQRIIVSGHYDTVVLTRAPGAVAPGPGETPPAGGNAPPLRDPNLDAPGVTDDGSGTACVMELARVLSQYQFEKTLVFVAFAGEENGLLGSSLYAQKARAQNQKIEAVLNNDIIGSDVAGNGRMENSRVSVFSEDPSDSTSRQLARYVREMGQRYVPSMKVDLMFRADRLGRGGDHTPFNQEGFAGVRFSSPQENFANQHSLTDTFANTSVPYIVRVVKVNAAAAASLAWAPKAPITMEEIERNGRKMPSLMLTRGKSRYDAALRWKHENPEPDLAGYAVLMRSTTAPYWEHDVFVGKVNEYMLPDVSIDEVLFGVKAVDKDGNESLVTPYVMGPRPKRVIQTY